MAKIITTVPDVKIKDLSRNLWFWVGIIALLMMLWIAYVNGTFAGLRDCPKKEE